MAEKCDLVQIKKDIETYIGKRIQLRANGGRKKSIVREGIIESTYPCVFVVKFENEYESTRRVSYSYTDVLTKVVEILDTLDGPTAQVS